MSKVWLEDDERGWEDCTDDEIDLQDDAPKV